MQWITLYYYGDDCEKMELARQGKQMKRFIRYSDVKEEIEEEQLNTLHDSKSRYVGINNNGIIAMFENNY